MIIELELRQEMTRALKGEASLNDLYSWLMSRSWNMHKDSAPAAIELAADVEVLFFERSSGDIDDAEIRRQLALLLVQAE